MGGLKGKMYQSNFDFTTLNKRNLPSKMDAFYEELEW
jgi:hypothetical protein